MSKRGANDDEEYPFTDAQLETLDKAEKGLILASPYQRISLGNANFHRLLPYSARFRADSGGEALRRLRRYGPYQDYSLYDVDDADSPSSSSRSY